MLTTKPTNVKPKMSAAIKPRPVPLASAHDSPNFSICQIDGNVKFNTQSCYSQIPAQTHGVQRLGVAEVRVGCVGVLHISSFAWSDRYAEACEK